jgi:hypothetical protein
MTGPCRFAYAQARVQARYAELPGEDAWQRLAAARTLGMFLEEAREGALRVWVKGFSAQSDGHDLDRGVRGIWQDEVTRVAAWLPQPWRPALLWLQWLPLLPLLAHAGRGGLLPVWVDLDRALHGLRRPDGTLDPAALIQAGGGALVSAKGEAVAGSEKDWVSTWAQEWRRHWPPCNRDFLAHMDGLAALIRAHASAFPQSGEAAWPLRRELRERLRLGFHRLPLQPAAAFSYLALLALDLERLRGALMERALFDPVEAA